MRALLHQICCVALSSSCVLISGETGSGKDLVARSIHEASGRKGEFVAVNCGAIAPGLIESELFGHEKGAFTGAHASRLGRIRQAEGGTLFLDEIGEMPLEAQAHLLRVLENSEVAPVGGQRSVPVDIRVVIATHRDLLEMAARKAFREDLIYRMNVLTVKVPALRDHREDIIPIACAMLARLVPSRRIRFTENARLALQNHAWKGNVRELRSVMERVCVYNETDVIDVSGLHLQTTPHPAVEMHRTASNQLHLPPIPLDLPYREAKALLLEHFEREFFSRHLRDCRGNVSRAARVLGMARQHLQEKLRVLRMKCRLPDLSHRNDADFEDGIL